MFLNPNLFELPYSEIKQYGKDNLVYGSLTESGLQTIITTIHTYHTGPIYGFDLGCGDGELVYHLQTMIPDSVWEGVEISEHRISMQRRDVFIWQGDMLEENYKPYNILHADNLCLTSCIQDRLEEKIAFEFTGLYITYRRPENIELLKKAVHLETIKTDVTWGKHDIHIYRV